MGMDTKKEWKKPELVILDINKDTELGAAGGGDLSANS